MFEDRHSILEEKKIYNKGLVLADPPHLVKDHIFTFFGPFPYAVATIFTYFRVKEYVLINMGQLFKNMQI